MTETVLIVEKGRAGGFAPLCGMWAGSVGLNDQTVDLPVRDDWKILLKSAGVRKATFSGRAVFADAPTDADARRAFFDDSSESYRVFVPGLGMVSGLFKIAKFELIGDGFEGYDFYLDSCGDVALAAEA